MEAITRNSYLLWQLGGGTQRMVFDRPSSPVEDARFIRILMDRTSYLKEVLPCNETADVPSWLDMALSAYEVPLPYEWEFHIVDPGHIYRLMDSRLRKLVFVKRSSGAIRYKKEWPGVQSQEVMRVLIHRAVFRFQNDDAAHALRMAIFLHEARAFRRKHEGVNRRSHAHNDDMHLDASRECLRDVPFDEHLIEECPIGPDGHIIV